jgi:GNAT superfamily N-acetyltransferase
MKYLTRLLNSTDDRKSFSCGKSVLDDYFHKQVKQDILKKITVCFVISDENEKINGFYTLSGYSIPHGELPEEISHKLPKSYSDIPATLLGRLAVDQHYQGSGTGELLLIDALKRSYDVSGENLGSMAVIVHPLDEDAVRFYKKYGFFELPDSKKMFLPMKTIGKLFK